MNKGSLKEISEEELEMEIDKALLLYFELPLSVLIDECPTPASEAAGLIRKTSRDDWIIDYEKIRLSIKDPKQKEFMAAIYNWIVNYSDNFRLMKLNKYEKIIVNYIMIRCP